MEFSYLLSVGEVDALKWREADLLNDANGDIVLRITPPRPQTARYIEWRAKLLKSADLPLVPVTSFRQWISLRSPSPHEDGPVSPLAPRSELSRPLGNAVISLGLGHTKVGTHSPAQAGRH